MGQNKYCHGPKTRRIFHELCLAMIGISLSLYPPPSLPLSLSQSLPLSPECPAKPENYQRLGG